jgi:hypothetical protein
VPCESVQSDARTGGFQRFVLVSDADPSHRIPVDVALSEVIEDELLVAHADIGGITAAGRTARIRLRLEFLDQSRGRTKLELRQDPSRDEICGDPGAAWESSFHPARLPVAALAVATADLGLPIFTLQRRLLSAWESSRSGCDDGGPYSARLGFGL